MLFISILLPQCDEFLHIEYDEFLHIESAYKLSYEMKGFCDGQIFDKYFLFTVRT